METLELNHLMARNITWSPWEGAGRPIPQHVSSSAPPHSPPARAGGRESQSCFCCSAHKIQMRSSHRSPDESYRSCLFKRSQASHLRKRQQFVCYLLIWDKQVLIWINSFCCILQSWNYINVVASADTALSSARAEQIDAGAERAPVLAPVWIHYRDPSAVVWQDWQVCNHDGRKNIPPPRFPIIIWQRLSNVSLSVKQTFGVGQSGSEVKVSLPIFLKKRQQTNGCWSTQHLQSIPRPKTEKNTKCRKRVRVLCGRMRCVRLTV